MMNKTIAVLGAKTLERYTEHLKRGFIKNEWNIDDTTQNTLLQIHGSPLAEEEDKALLFQLEMWDTDSNRNIVVLVHRPDEVKDRHPFFQQILEKLTKPLHIVFLGDAYVHDPFYCQEKVKISVVPHGFFDFNPVIPRSLVVGTHTTWGEMRSVDHILCLLGHLFKQGISGVSGYLGGLPANELDTDVLEKKFRGIHPDVSVRFVRFGDEDPRGTEHTITVHIGQAQPQRLEIMFNTQLYFYGTKIRTGESSGSVHSTLSIPVVIEMNGSDRIEDLAVIKVPYGDISNIESVDFSSAARNIAEIITSGRYHDMLEHNKKQTMKFNNQFVAGEYIRIFADITR